MREDFGWKKTFDGRQPKTKKFFYLPPPQKIFFTSPNKIKCIKKAFLCIQRLHYHALRHFFIIVFTSSPNFSYSISQFCSDMLNSMGTSKNIKHRPFAFYMISVITNSSCWKVVEIFLYFTVIYVATTRVSSVIIYFSAQVTEFLFLFISSLILLMFFSISSCLNTELKAYGMTSTMMRRPTRRMSRVGRISFTS